jgi:hypothetical protein
MGVMQKILNLPAFFLGIFFLYWSLPLAALMNKVKFLKLVGKRNDAYGWCAAPGLSPSHIIAVPACPSMHHLLQDTQLSLPCRGVALQHLFGVTMLRLPGPAVYNRGGPVLFLVFPATLLLPSCCKFCKQPVWQDPLHAQDLRADSNALLQSNHRSWADFYLDVVATDGNAQMLSRMMVALAFPMFMGAVCVIRSVVLFQRNRKHDKEARACHHPPSLF